jgi:hypothetical protein
MYTIAYKNIYAVLRVVNYVVSCGNNSRSFGLNLAVTAI